jgi:DNA-binding MarR family transcriptional regulator
MVAPLQVTRKKTARKKTPPAARRATADFGLRGNLQAGYQIARLARLIARNATRRLAEEVGLTLAEWRILLLMGDDSPVHLDALAEKALLEKSHASIAATALVRHKLVKRIASPGDARRVLLSRTSQGSRLVARYLAATAQERRALWGVLSAQQQATLHRCLARLLEVAEQDSFQRGTRRPLRRRARR